MLVTETGKIYFPLFLSNFLPAVVWVVLAELKKLGVEATTYAKKETSWYLSSC